MEINKSLRQLKYIDQEALWKYNIEENVGFKLQNEPVNHRCCDYLSEDIYVGTAHMHILQPTVHGSYISDHMARVYTKNNVSQIDVNHDKV